MPFALLFLAEVPVRLVLEEKSASAPWQSLMTSRKGRSRRRGRAGPVARVRGSGIGRFRGRRGQARRISQCLHVHRRWGERSVLQ